MSKPIIVLGAGGHARVVLDALYGERVVGLTDPDPAKKGQYIGGFMVLGDDSVLAAYPPQDVLLVNGIGSIGDNTLRRMIFARYKAAGYEFLSVVHAASVIAADVVIGEGVQVMAGAVLQVGCRVADNAIINTRAVIDHDCNIGQHVHIAPGAVLSGGVSVGDNVHIGTGATIIQGIRIGDASMVGAGAVVVRDVPPGVTVLGIPAKEMK